MDDFNIKDGILFKCYDKNITHARIPDNVHTIFDGAFEYCEKLEDVYLNFVRRIGNCAFISCISLHNLLLPEPVYIIGDRAFMNCSSLVDVYMFDTVKTLGRQAFAYCNSLARLKLSDSLTHVADKAFIGCDHLSFLGLGDNTVYIGRDSFYDCRALETINTIGSDPNLYLYIDDGAFGRCEALKTIYKRKDTIIEAHKNAFIGCDNLKGEQVI